MLIKFEIQVNGSGTATVTQAEAAINPNAPAQKSLGEAFVAPAAGKKGGSAPIDGPGAGPPAGISASSGSGMMFIIGPIIICGSGPGETGAGGSAPIDGPGAGPPANDKAGV
jgi:hypothetical protein